MDDLALLTDLAVSPTLSRMLHIGLFIRVPLRDMMGDSGPADSAGLTGGVYKTRERIHRGVLTHDY